MPIKAITWMLVRPHIAELAGPLWRAQSDAEALELSIEKWETIVAIHTEYPQVVEINNMGAGSCGLCMRFRIFNNELRRIECEGCPVFAKTGKHGCNGTPYAKYDDEPSLETAKAELEFLKSLRQESNVTQA